MSAWMCAILRLGLASIFLYAGLIKASNSQQFAMGLVPFTFLPAHWTGFLAVVIAWTEVVAGAVILLPRIYLVGAGMIGGLCIVFIVALSWALWNGIVIPCSCFGDGATPSESAMVMAIIRDASILVSIGILTFLTKRA